MAEVAPTPQDTRSRMAAGSDLSPMPISASQAAAARRVCAAGCAARCRNGGAVKAGIGLLAVFGMLVLISFAVANGEVRASALCHLRTTVT